jgi:hypothetical protein
MKKIWGGNMNEWRGAIYMYIFFMLCIITPGDSTAGVSGSFYNSDYSMSFGEEGQNANWGGVVQLLPYAGYCEFPHAIYFESSGNPNSNSGLTKFSSTVSASNHMKTAASTSILEEDPSIKPYLSVKFGHEVALGSTSGGDCSLTDHITIESKPGYLTFPSGRGISSITAGMTLEGSSSVGIPLFDKKYMPPAEFGDFPVTFGVMKSEYDDVYMKNSFSANMKWE